MSHFALLAAAAAGFAVCWLLGGLAADPPGVRALSRIHCRLPGYLGSALFALEVVCLVSGVAGGALLLIAHW